MFVVVRFCVTIAAKKYLWWFNFVGVFFLSVSRQDCSVRQMNAYLLALLHYLLDDRHVSWMPFPPGFADAIIKSIANDISLLSCHTLVFWFILHFNRLTLDGSTIPFFLFFLIFGRSRFVRRVSYEFSNFRVNFFVECGFFTGVLTFRLSFAYNFVPGYNIGVAVVCMGLGAVVRINFFTASRLALHKFLFQSLLPAGTVLWSK